jgi:hypothetical protein
MPTILLLLYHSLNHSFLKQPTSKKKKGKVTADSEDKAFDSMVSKYKSMVSNKDMKKWYE